MESSERPDLGQLRIDRGSRGREGGGLRTLAVAGVVLVSLGVVTWFIVARGAAAARVQVAPARGATAGSSAGTVLNASGYITPRRRATVAAKITGRVSEMLVEEGIHVAAGQVLARLDPSEYQAALDVAVSQRDVASKTVAEADVTLADAERTLGRNRELREKGFVTQEELDRAATAVDLARARLQLAREQVTAASRQVDLAQRNLDNCTVTSPFEGIAVSKDAQVGEIVSPVSAGGGFTRTGISTIVDMTSLEVEVDVNESNIARVAVDQPVEITLDAYPDWQMPGKVRTTIPTADRQKATVKVRITIEHLDPRILPDMGAKVAFLRAAGAPESSSAGAARVLVPKDAVHEVEGKKVVYVVVNGKLERRAVSVGSENGSDIEVISGLIEGDSVVVKGPAEMRDGLRAEIIKE